MSPGQPEANGITWERVRAKLSEIAAARGEWSGAPIPLEDEKLVVDPRYAFQKLNGLSVGKVDEEAAAESRRRCAAAFDFGDDGEGSIYLVNVWWSRRLQKEVFVYHTGDGRSKVGIHWMDGTARRMDMMLRMLSPVYGGAWSWEMEARATQTLGGMIPPHHLEYYRVTGTFLETSQRSKVTYCFRRGRPTLAMRPHDGGMRVLAALCQHPIGYYEGTWCGVMCPTDDVIAHLTLMRGDEWLFWKTSNQHAPDTIEAGL